MCAQERQEKKHRKRQRGAEVLSNTVMMGKGKLREKQLSELVFSSQSVMSADKSSLGLCTCGAVRLSLVWLFCLSSWAVQWIGVCLCVFFFPVLARRHVSKSYEEIQQCIVSDNTDRMGYLKCNSEPRRVLQERAFIIAGSKWNFPAATL